MSDSFAIQSQPDVPTFVCESSSRLIVQASGHRQPDTKQSFPRSWTPLTGRELWAMYAPEPCALPPCGRGAGSNSDGPLASELSACGRNGSNSELSACGRNGSNSELSANGRNGSNSDLLTNGPGSNSDRTFSSELSASLRAPSTGLLESLLAPAASARSILDKKEPALADGSCSLVAPKPLSLLGTLPLASNTDALGMIPPLARGLPPSPSNSDRPVASELSANGRNGSNSEIATSAIPSFACTTGCFLLAAADRPESEDAVIAREDSTRALLAVADGIGGWKSIGISAAEFAGH